MIMIEGIGFVVGFLLGSLFAIIIFILMKKILFTNDPQVKLNDFKKFNLEIQEIKKFQKKLIEKEQTQNQKLQDLNLIIKKVIVEKPLDVHSSKNFDLPNHHQFKPLTTEEEKIKIQEEPKYEN